MARHALYPFNPVGKGLGQHRLDARDILLAGGHHQLAAAVEGDLVDLQEVIESSPPLDAEAGLQRTGGIVEPAVDHLRISRRDPLADGRLPLQHDRRQTSLSESVGDGQADRPCSNDGDVEV